MSDWYDIARDSFEAARLLGQADRHRSSVSRYYYSAFSMATARLKGRVAFARGREAPAHKVLPELTERNAPELSVQVRRKVKAAIRRLYTLRVSADYSAAFTVDARSVWEAHQNAFVVARLLGENNDPSD